MAKRVTMRATKNNSEEKDRNLIANALKLLVPSADAAGDHKNIVDDGSQTQELASTMVYQDDSQATLEHAPGPHDSVSGRPIQRLGEYEIAGVLGQVGMGVVYKAFQPRIGRWVALKMIRSGIFVDQRESIRFQNEVEAVAALDRPNIVPVLEFGAVDSQKYFTMKLIEGGTLSGKVNQWAKTPREAAMVMMPIARAIFHAHQRGILHQVLQEYWREAYSAER